MHLHIASIIDPLDQHQSLREITYESGNYYMTPLDNEHTNWQIGKTQTPNRAARYDTGPSADAGKRHLSANKIVNIVYRKLAGVPGVACVNIKVMIPFYIPSHHSYFLHLFSPCHTCCTGK